KFGSVELGDVVASAAEQALVLGHVEDAALARAEHVAKGAAEIARDLIVQLPRPRDDVRRAQLAEVPGIECDGVLAAIAPILARGDLGLPWTQPGIRCPHRQTPGPRRALHHSFAPSRESAFELI